MGLDFTSIPDKTGAAAYIIYDGNELQARSSRRLADEVASRSPKHQVVVISAKSNDGTKIVDFYSLDRMNFPHVLVIGDDDQIIHHWSGHNGLPTAEQLAYSLRSVSAQ